MAISAAYLNPTPKREPMQWGPESSRRARGVEIWAALRSLGVSGVGALIEGTCQHATHFAEGLRQAGFQVLNDVALNQVLVSFGTDEHTSRVIDALQLEGTCYCGGTVWRGQKAMRISVSSWATSESDVEMSLAAMVKAARKLT
jgi:aromatic-L-amino-acid decarboxylase